MSIWQRVTGGTQMGVALVLAAGLLWSCGEDPANGNNSVNNNNNTPTGECGDGQLDTGEQCDDGALNSDSTPDACRTDCRLAFCGDGVADDGEPCDDGNTDETDACLASCVAASCGDGFLQDGVEECDDGVDNSDVSSNACRTSCALPSCGDGVYDPNAAAPEECDDGNTSEADGCLNDCTISEGFVLYDLGFGVGGSRLAVGGSDDGSYLMVFNSSLAQLASLLVDDLGTWQAGPSYSAESVDSWPAIAPTGDGYILARNPDGNIVVSTLDTSGIELSSGSESSAFAALLDVAKATGREPVYLKYQLLPMSPVSHFLNVDSIPTAFVEMAQILDFTEGQLSTAADGYLAVWTDSTGVLLGRWLSLDLVPEPAGSFTLNDDATNAPATDGDGPARIDCLSDGTCLVVWTADVQGSLEVRGRILQPDRSFLGPEFVINDSAAGDSSTPDLAVSYDDRFIVAWYRSFATDLDVEARTVLFDGSFAGPSTSIYHQSNAPALSRVRVGASSTGAIVAWTEEIGGVLRASIIPRLVP